MKKLIAIFVILLTMATKAFAFEAIGSPSDNSKFFLPIVLVVVALYIILILYLPKLSRFFFGKRWDELSFEEQCAQMAIDLKNGKRKWYLKDHGDSFLAAPVSGKKMDEMGEGYHILTDEVRIKRLITEGKIDNVPTFWTVLKYLDKINSKK